MDSTRITVTKTVSDGITIEVVAIIMNCQKQRNLGDNGDNGASEAHTSAGTSRDRHRRL